MKNKKIAALLTARGNNSLKNKHLRKICGKRLVEYPMSIVRDCDIFDKIYISSDDKNILSLGNKYNFSLIKRPEYLSKPDSLHVDALKHALEFMKKNDGYEPDILVVILGNAISIKREWILDSVEMLRKNNVSAVVPVHIEQNFHPFRAKRIDSEGILKPYFDFPDNVISSNRQDLPANYFLCHNFWTLDVKKSILSDSGLPPWNFMGDSVIPIIIDRTIDVHDELDIELCRKLIKQGKL